MTASTPARRTLAVLVATAAGLSAALAPTATATGATAAPSSTTAARAAGATGAAARADRRYYDVKTPTSRGFGGAVTSVDPEASRAGIRALRRGGNAVDAAIATAAALGVTEPYSSGIGGGGYLVFRNGRTGRISTIDGRETAPARMPRNAFVDPRTGKFYPFTPELVTSGVSVGTPGTLATWDTALRRWGRTRLPKVLRGAARLADRGFRVDQTFHDQTADNQRRFAQFPASSRLFLPGGKPPAVGTIFRNRELAATYRLIARRGTSAFYRGTLAREISSNVKHPRTAPGHDLPVPPGYLEPSDLARYSVRRQAATKVRYRGYDVYGMAPSSSGGTTVGEALNILERYPLSRMGDAAALHHYLEASALAFADRGAYVGDPRYTNVPTGALLSDRFAAERACSLDEHHAATKPVAPGNVSTYDGRCRGSTASAHRAADTENVSTTNLTTADRWGNVVEYTLTIEQTGGSGMVVPGRGFLLNNELTDFSYDSTNPREPNAIRPGARPRSSMSPTIVLRHGKPFLALGSPGGSTIITTVLQIMVDRLDRGMSIQQAIAAPRASQRNTASVTAEPEFISRYGSALKPYGHTLVPSGDAFTSAAQIGAATAIEFAPRGRLTAVSEPVRRGGGSALVVRSSR